MSDDKISLICLGISLVLVAIVAAVAMAGSL